MAFVWHLWSHQYRLVRPQGSMDKPQSLSPRSRLVEPKTGGYLNGTLSGAFWRQFIARVGRVGAPISC